MKVWLLEYSCSDDAAWQFEGLFNSIQAIYDYLAETYPETEYHSFAFRYKGKDYQEIWEAGRYKNHAQRSPLEQPDFLASWEQVR